VIEPGTFLTTLTFQTIAGDNAVGELLALAMLLPLVTGSFDLSVANVAGFAMVTSSHLSAHSHVGTVAICAIVLAGSIGFGLISAVVVAAWRVNSLIATLGIGTVALSITELISKGQTITAGFSESFARLGTGRVLGVPLPFVYVLVAAALAYALLEHTPTGRRLAAIGGNPVAARLAGIRIARLRAGTLIASSALAGFAGLVLATQTGIASTATAPPLLLPAVAALFLGSTQFNARVNAWGTVLAGLLLGTGIRGLQLLGTAPWVSEFFNGSVLVIAVCIAARGTEPG
jgi:ribose transport system permease protein